MALEHVRALLGDGGVERYKLAAMSVSSDLMEVAETAGWKASPLTVACTLGYERKEPFDPAPHLRVVSDAIVRAVQGTGPRFIVVSMPPRYGKSMLISRRTPAWFLANFPHRHVGVCGYGDDFGSGSPLVRNGLQDHPERFGFGVAQDSSAAAQWHTTLGGSMWSAGVGGSVTGKGADLLVVDDPIKNSEEATSLTHQDRVWNWWTSTARTRLQQGAVCVVVMTRWHSSDLLGRLLSGYDGTDARDWLEIKLPAIWDKDVPDLLGRAKGQLLWPERFDDSEMEKTRRSVGEETWAALYQQTPLDQTAFGKVYHAFEEQVHVRELYRDERLPVCVGMDFNVDPGSFCVAQIRDYFGPRAHLTNERVSEIELLDEISIGNSNTQMMCDELHARLRKLAGGRPMKVQVYGDATGNLGCRVPFGAHLRYWVRNRERELACLLWTSPAWKMQARDAWIGWNDEQRQRNLQWIVNNGRFLILPWVRVQGLASKILALSARRLPPDWENHYGYRPLLLETLVDAARFRGTCYRAANWIHVGQTAGRGRMDRAHTAHGQAVKDIYVYPLARDARQQLCRD